MCCICYSRCYGVSVVIDVGIISVVCDMSSRGWMDGLSEKEKGD
jgi:hypothetical protein